jgi:hypothetical protein
MGAAARERGKRLLAAGLRGHVGASPWPCDAGAERRDPTGRIRVPFGGA